MRETNGEATAGVQVPVELWRTSPYLHHGKAVTLEALLTDFNPHDQHGRTSDLSAQELEDLILYLNSL